MKENTSDNQNTDNLNLTQCGKKISWHERVVKYFGFKEREHIGDIANHMISINQYKRIPRISSRSINYEIMNQIQEADNAIVHSNRVIEERRSTMIEIQGNALKVGDEVEICSYPRHGTKITTKIIEVGATSEISTKTFYRTETGALYYIESDGNNRHYNLGNRAFWIENPTIRKNICSQCDYYLHGYPPVCNAFHEPGVSSCSDFQDKNKTKKLKQEKRKQELREFCNQIQIKIDLFRYRYNQHPSKILLHPITYEHFCDYLRAILYSLDPESHPSGYERGGRLLFCDTEVIVSSSVEENYIGLVIDTIE